MGSNYILIRDGRPPDLSGIPDFFLFLLSWKKKPEPGKLTIFILEKNGGMIRHYSRRAAHPHFSVQIEKYPYFPSENPRFLFCFEIGKTKRRILLHVPCLKAYKAWAKNKFCDRLN